MASARDIVAGRAFIIVSATDKVSAGLDRIAAKFNAFGRIVRNIGFGAFAFGSAQLASFAVASKLFADMGANLKLMSQRTGIAVATLSGLRYVAEQTGVAVDDLELPLRKMQRNIVEAAEGGKEAIRAFQLLGLSVSSFRGKTADQQIGIIADSMSQLSDPTLKASLSLTIFGKSGTALLPMLDLGSKGIEKFTAHARELSGGLSDKQFDDAATAALGLKRKMDDLSFSLKMLSFNFGEALGGSQFIQGVTNAVVAASKFIRANHDLVMSAFYAAAGITVTGAALIGFGFVIEGLAPVISLASGGLRLFGSVALGVAAILRTGIGIGAIIFDFKSLYAAVVAVGVGIAKIPSIIGTALGAILKIPALIGGAFELALGAIGALASPMFLLGAAAIAVGVAAAGIGIYFLYTSGVIGEAINAIKGYFSGLIGYFKPLWDGLKSDAIEAFSGIKNALAAADFGTAIQILWTTLKLEFARGMQAIWDPLVNGFYRAIDKIQDAWHSVMNEITGHVDTPEEIAAIAKSRADRATGRDAESEAEIAELKKQLDALTAKAAAENKRADSSEQKENPLSDELPNRGMPTNGTFNPTAASRLGENGSVFNRIADNTKKTAENTDPKNKPVQTPEPQPTPASPASPTPQPVPPNSIPGRSTPDAPIPQNGWFQKAFHAATGLSLEFSSGGHVPGTGAGDTVPAMLTPGEFVVTKDAAQRNHNLLAFINQGGKPRTDLSDPEANIEAIGTKRKTSTQFFAEGGEVQDDQIIPQGNDEDYRPHGQSTPPPFRPLTEKDRQQHEKEEPYHLAHPVDLSSIPDLEGQETDRRTRESLPGLNYDPQGPAANDFHPPESDPAVAKVNAAYTADWQWKQDERTARLAAEKAKREQERIAKRNAKHRVEDSPMGSPESRDALGGTPTITQYATGQAALPGFKNVGGGTGPDNANDNSTYRAGTDTMGATIGYGTYMDVVKASRPPVVPDMSHSGGTASKAPPGVAFDDKYKAAEAKLNAPHPPVIGTGKTGLNVPTHYDLLAKNEHENRFGFAGDIPADALARVQERGKEESIEYNKFSNSLPPRYSVDDKTVSPAQRAARKASNDAALAKFRDEQRVRRQDERNVGRPAFLDRKSTPLFGPPKAVTSPLQDPSAVSDASQAAQDAKHQLADVYQHDHSKDRDANLASARANLAAKNKAAVDAKIASHKKQSVAFLPPKPTAANIANNIQQSAQQAAAPPPSSTPGSAVAAKGAANSTAKMEGLLEKIAQGIDKLNQKRGGPAFG